MPDRRTYREVDGERIEGTARPIFIRNGSTYFLTELLVFADGAIWCWEWVDLDGLRDKLRDGWVATTLVPGAEASAHELASWRFADPQMWIGAEELLGEVADAIERLNGRPDATDRCLQAVVRYRHTHAEPDRVTLRAAYLAIPSHRRRYALGDMDLKDWPLRVLCTDLGDRLDGDGAVVTEQLRQQALEYFAERDQQIEAERRRVSADGPDDADAAVVALHETVYPRGWPAEPGILVLRNEYPAPIRVGSVTYPTVVHAYWALSVADPAAHDRIGAASSPYEAQDLAQDAPRRADWPAIRLAVMAELLRAKFTQHPKLAEVLMGTGAGRIHYSGLGSPYWLASGSTGRNWTGRLLELIRAELLARRAGTIPG